MANLFLKLLNMSISAGYLVLAVVLLRLVLKKAPRWTRVLLWGIVAIRLICPFSIESALSLIPNPEPISADILQEASPSINSSLPTIDPSAPPYINPDPIPTPSIPILDTVTVTASADPGETYLAVASIIWLAGMSLMMLYMIISYWQLRRRVTTAIRVHDRIYQGETVVSPFVLGILRPRIYLPSNLSPQDLPHVIAHEQAHIRRKDHWWKPLGFLLLTLYWFNPLMWLAFLLLCRDIELACDEKVIKQLESDQRADYSQALLKCSARRRSIAACPLAFGEVGVKERVKNVLSYKKPAFWIIIVAVIACAAVAVCFLTDPLSEVHAEGTQPTETQPVTVAPGPALLWYDSATATASGQMKLDTIPGITFQWDTSAVTAVSEQGETVLLQALVIRNIYSADLTGDGIPEICATVDNKSGMYDCHVIVYDYAAGISYTYGPNGDTYAYYLHIADGYLMCSQVPFDNPSVTVASGRLIFTITDDSKALAMEGAQTNQSQLNQNVPGPAEAWYQIAGWYNRERGEFQVEAFPGVTFRWNIGTVEAVTKEGTITIMDAVYLKNIGAVDLNMDGYPEICGTAVRSTEEHSCYVLVYDYAAGKSYTFPVSDENTGFYLYTLSGYVMCGKERLQEDDTYEAGRLMLTGAEENMALTIVVAPPPAEYKGDPVLWIDISDPNAAPRAEVQLDAFPGVTFRWNIKPNWYLNDKFLIAEKDGVEIPLFDQHGGISSVYVADVTGDGKPDICANGYHFFSGLPSYNAVYVYDYANGKYYSLVDTPHTNHYTKVSYYIRMENGQLVCDQIHEATQQTLATGILTFVDGKLDLDAQITYDSPVEYELVIKDEYLRDIIQLITEADGTCRFSPTMHLNRDGTSNSITGTYTKTDTHLTMQADDGRTYTFCCRGDDLIFLASSSSPLPKGSLLENGMLLTGKPYFTPEEIG